MLRLRGGPALSAFRIEKLLRRINALAPEVTSLSATFLHLIDTDGDLAEPQRAVLAGLLGDGPTADSVTADCWVTPRFGTISPWSSKATDIAHVCGLDTVRRIERVVEFRLTARGPLDAALVARIAPALARAAVAGALGCTEDWVAAAHQDQGLDWREVA